MENEVKHGTTFCEIYCMFLDQITDDLFMEMDLEDTLACIESIFKDSLPHFDFPRFRINRHVMDAEVESCGGTEQGFKGAFVDELTLEEKGIIAKIMLKEWLQRQLHTTKVVQMKYSTSDFKMTSQAAHMQRLNSLITTLGKEIYHDQRMYQRRIENEDGYIVANYDGLAYSGRNRPGRKPIFTPLGEVKQ